MALEWLAAEHYEVWAADAAGEPAGTSRPPARVALVAGNEGAGVSTEVMDRAGRTVSVPIRGNAESLNVAVATGILLYALTRED
jgi:TrmH family RNA methyltransferase